MKDKFVDEELKKSFESFKEAHEDMKLEDKLSILSSLKLTQLVNEIVKDNNSMRKRGETILQEMNNFIKAIELNNILLEQLNNNLAKKEEKKENINQKEEILQTIKVFLSNNQNYINEVKNYLKSLNDEYEQLTDCSVDELLAIKEFCRELP